MKLKKALWLTAGAAAVWTGAELAAKLAQRPIADLPKFTGDTETPQTPEDEHSIVVIYNSLSGRRADAPEPTEEYVHKSLKMFTAYVDKRYDCSDFKMQILFRIYKDCFDRLSPRCRQLLKDTCLSFKYFMDEPGHDSMCYWSENHQILFAVAEYLAGQEWPTEVFTNNGMTGAEHMAKARERILAWCDQRAKFGFSECLSNVYLMEDIAPLANCLTFCKDKEIVERVRNSMDLLWLDVALHTVNNRFVAASTRMYGNNKASNHLGNSIQACMNTLWGAESDAALYARSDLTADEKALIKRRSEAGESGMNLNFIAAVEQGHYTLPDVIKSIALADGSREVRMGCGLSPEDLEREGLIGHEPHQIMAQWGAETFTNKQVVNNTFNYLKSNDMFRNKFLFYFKFLDMTAFKLLDLEKLSGKHELMTHGIALGRSNIYSYKSGDYLISTAVKKSVNSCGTQEHIWSANLGENLAVFTTHPAKGDDKGFASSPGYWIGNGRLPMSVGFKGINITIYKLPTGRRFPELSVAKMTHAYMPKCFFDELEQRGNTVFGRKGRNFIAMISNGELKYKPYNEDSALALFKGNPPPGEQEDLYRLCGEFDLCRYGGEYHCYITELSDSGKESFDEFKARIASSKAIFGSGSVHYIGSEDIEVSHSGVFRVNGEDMPTEFDRYDFEHCHAKRKAPAIKVSNGKSSLTLDFS